MIQEQLLPLLAPGEDGLLQTPALLHYFSIALGPETSSNYRDRCFQLMEELNRENTPERREMIAFAVSELLSPELNFGDTELSELDLALERLGEYQDKIRLLSRARSVAEDTDVALGSFLLTLPYMPGGSAQEMPPQEEFQSKLAAALDALESEYSLLSEERMEGAFSTSRRQILMIRLRDLRELLVGEGKPGQAMLNASAEARDLESRLQRTIPLPREASELPADSLSLIELWTSRVPTAFEGVDSFIQKVRERLQAARLHE